MLKIAYYLGNPCLLSRLISREDPEPRTGSDWPNEEDAKAQREKIINCEIQFGNWTQKMNYVGFS